MRSLVWIRRALTASLTCVAFWNSYTHTVDWFTEHGQAAQAGWLALIPEVGVILVVLTLALDKLNTAQKWIVGSIGAGSLLITFTANLAGASDGPMGIAAALVAPVFAVLGFALEALALLGKKMPKPASKKTQKPATEPKKAPAVRRQSLTDTGILWATQRVSDGGTWPTTVEVLAEFPDISRTTARKIHNAEPMTVS